MLPIEKTKKLTKDLSPYVIGLGVIIGIVIFVRLKTKE